MDIIKVLIGLGLNRDGAEIYHVLLQNGFLSAKVIAKKTGVGRTLVYRNLSLLEKSGLVEKKEQVKGITLFYPTHPSSLQKLIDEKESSINLAKNSLSQVMGKFSSDYNALVGKPNVKFYEGISGIQKLYDDILETEVDLFLIRSPFDKKNEALTEILEIQQQKQNKAGIRVKALTPFVHTTARGIRKSLGKPSLVSRCIIPDNFDIPAEILIYENKVGIVSLKNNIMTTIIENNDIAETMKILFEKIWTLSTPDSDKLYEKITLNQI